MRQEPRIPRHGSGLRHPAGLQLRPVHVPLTSFRLDLRKYTKKEENAKFEVLYNFRRDYGVEDMSVAVGMTAFNAKMRDDAETQKKYWYYRRSGLEQPKAGR